MAQVTGVRQLVLVPNCICYLRLALIIYPIYAKVEPIQLMYATHPPPLVYKITARVLNV